MYFSFFKPFPVVDTFRMLSFVSSASSGTKLVPRVNCSPLGFNSSVEIFVFVVALVWSEVYSVALLFFLTSVSFSSLNLFATAGLRQPLPISSFCFFCVTWSRVGNLDFSG